MTSTLIELKPIGNIKKDAETEIRQYTKERIPDVLQFERNLRAEEDF